MPNQFKFEVKFTQEDVDALLSVSQAEKYLVSASYYYDGDWKMFTSAQGIGCDGKAVGHAITLCPTPCPPSNQDSLAFSATNEVRFQVRFDREHFEDLRGTDSDEFFVKMEHGYNGSWNMIAVLYSYDKKKTLSEHDGCPTPCPILSNASISV